MSYKLFNPFFFVFTMFCNYYVYVDTNAQSFYDLHFSISHFQGLPLFVCWLFTACFFRLCWSMLMFYKPNMKWQIFIDICVSIKPKIPIKSWAYGRPRVFVCQKILIFFVDYEQSQSVCNQAIREHRKSWLNHPDFGSH